MQTIKIKNTGLTIGAISIKVYVHFLRIFLVSRYENAAKLILDALCIEHTEDFIDGITTVLDAQHEAINNEWEAYITLSTDEILSTDNIACVHCGTPIQISRTRSTVYVGEVYDE